jgi:hypothetical protein
MQAITDEMFESCKEYFDTALKEAPDTVDIHMAKRLFRTIKYVIPSAPGLNAWVTGFIKTY